jgi:hypothetical protein
MLIVRFIRCFNERSRAWGSEKISFHDCGRIRWLVTSTKLERNAKVTSHDYGAQPMIAELHRVATLIT